MYNIIHIYISTGFGWHPPSMMRTEMDVESRNRGVCGIFRRFVYDTTAVLCTTAAVLLLCITTITELFLVYDVCFLRFSPWGMKTVRIMITACAIGHCCCCCCSVKYILIGIISCILSYGEVHTPHVCSLILFLIIQCRT